MLKLLAIGAVLSIVACVDEDPTITIETAQPVDQSEPQADVARDVSGRESLCEMLPSDPADPCSHVCDQEGIGKYIPEHTCTTFVCHLTDGTTFLTGGCVP